MAQYLSRTRVGKNPKFVPRQVQNVSSSYLRGGGGAPVSAKEAMAMASNPGIATKPPMGGGKNMAIQAMAPNVVGTKTPGPGVMNETVSTGVEAAANVGGGSGKKGVSFSSSSSRKRKALESVPGDQYLKGSGQYKPLDKKPRIEPRSIPGDQYVAASSMGDLRQPRGDDAGSEGVTEKSALGKLVDSDKAKELVESFNDNPKKAIFKILKDYYRPAMNAYRLGKLVFTGGADGQDPSQVVGDVISDLMQIAASNGLALGAIPPEDMEEIKHEVVRQKQLNIQENVKKRTLLSALAKAQSSDSSGYTPQEKQLMKEYAKQIGDNPKAYQLELMQDLGLDPNEAAGGNLAMTEQEQLAYATEAFKNLPGDSTTQQMFAMATGQQLPEIDTVNPMGPKVTTEDMSFPNYAAFDRWYQDMKAKKKASKGNFAPAGPSAPGAPTAPNVLAIAGPEVAAENPEAAANALLEQAGPYDQMNQKAVQGDPNRLDPITPATGSKQTARTANSIQGIKDLRAMTMQTVEAFGPAAIHGTAEERANMGKGALDSHQFNGPYDYPIYPGGRPDETLTLMGAWKTKNGNDSSLWYSKKTAKGADAKRNKYYKWSTKGGGGWRKLSKDAMVNVFGKNDRWQGNNFYNVVAGTKYADYQKRMLANREHNYALGRIGNQNMVNMDHSDLTQKKGTMLVTKPPAGATTPNPNPTSTFPYEKSVNSVKNKPPGATKGNKNKTPVI